MNVLLFGATGMVGQGVLRECLLDPDVQLVGQPGEFQLAGAVAVGHEAVIADALEAGVPPALGFLRRETEQTFFSHRTFKNLALSRGRDVGYPTPPAQIRTCRIPAYGSYLRYLASKRTLGCGCRIFALGIHRSTNRKNRSQVIRSRWLRRRSARYQRQIT